MVVNSALLVNKPKLVAKHQYGGNFYKKWQPWEIARLQRFLAREDIMGNNNYKGEEDGKMSKALFDAIKYYQAHVRGVTADGLWGYNTNLHHHVLQMDTLSKGSYKSNYKTELGSSLIRKPMIFTYSTADQFTPKQLEDARNYYLANPAEFMSNDETASYWRQVFHNSGKWGADQINLIASTITPEERKKLDSRKLTMQWKTDNVKDAIYEGQKKVMPGLLTALAAPVVIGGVAAPLLGGAAVETLAGLGASYVGAKVGGAVGKQIGGAVANTDKIYSDPVQSRYGAVSVIHDPKRAIQEAERTGEFVGSMVGGALGGASGNALGAGARKQVINTMGAGRASYKPKTRFSSPTETTAEPFGNIKLGDVKGISKPRLFMKGVKARISPQPGQTRAGGVYGIKHNGNPHYNPGTWSDTKTIEAATQYWNNPQAPTKIVFGGSQNLSRGVKIGQAMELNWPGIGSIAGYMAPAYGYTSIFNTEYQTTPRNRDKKKDKSKKATE
jgi:hypothetical protein